MRQLIRNIVWEELDGVLEMEVLFLASTWRYKNRKIQVFYDTCHDADDSMLHRMTACNTTESGALISKIIYFTDR